MTNYSSPQSSAQIALAEPTTFRLSEQANKSGALVTAEPASIALAEVGRGTTVVRRRE
jgi:hypothetical protein